MKQIITFKLVNCKEKAHLTRFLSTCRRKEANMVRLLPSQIEQVLTDTDLFIEKLALIMIKQYRNCNDLHLLLTTTMDWINYFCDVAYNPLRIKTRDDTCPIIVSAPHLFEMCVNVTRQNVENLNDLPLPKLLIAKISTFL